MRQSIRYAIWDAVYESMNEDSSIFILGEGARVKCSFDYPSILDRFPERVVTAPVAEAGIVNVALGAALNGARPIVDLTFDDLSLRAAEEIINQVAKAHFMTGGKLKARVVIKADFNRPENCQSGSRWEALFLHSPGIRVYIPSTPKDAKFMMRSALIGEDPVLFFEDRIIDFAQDLEDPSLQAPDQKIGLASTVVKGDKLTAVSFGYGVHLAMQALERLSAPGAVEIIDLRTLNPLDIDTVKESVSRTGKLLTVECGQVEFGIGAELAARVSQDCFRQMSKPPVRLGMKKGLFPAATSLQQALLPSVEQVHLTMKQLLGGGETRWN
jgi:pyruvate/2-oxoglutarate/acetoin dehydrogenase E1 component